jgi:hypothetical protein
MGSALSASLSTSVLLHVNTSDYLPLSDPTQNMLEMIRGMRVCRDKCKYLASTQLAQGLLDEPSLASFGSSPHQSSLGTTLVRLLSQAAVAKPVMDAAIRDGLVNLDVNPDAVLDVDRPGKDRRSFPTFLGAPLKTVRVMSGR